MAREPKENVQRALINDVPLSQWMAMPRCTMKESGDVSKKLSFAIAKNFGSSILLALQL